MNQRKSDNSSRSGGGNKKDFRKRPAQGGRRNAKSPLPQPLSRERERVAVRPGEGATGIILKAGREKSLQRRHPWIFSGAIECINGTPNSGDTLPVRDIAGNFLAWAAYNADSQITARVWSWDEQEAIDAGFFHRKISQAIKARHDLLPSPVHGSTKSTQSTTRQVACGVDRGAGGEGFSDDKATLSLTLEEPLAIRLGGQTTSAKSLVISREREREQIESNGMRLIHGESDGLPGLIVDQYGDVLVLQLGSAGPEHWRETLADILQELCSPVCIYERSDSDGRELEGLPKRCGVLRGALPEKIEVVENGLRFAVDVAEGQKTGYYLDQRDNRALTGTLAADRDVLNCFCYTGGFSLYALRGGAKSVLSIDASESALELARRNVELNGLDAAKAEWQCADVFEALRKLRDQNRKFDLIVLDPPKFAPTAAFAEKASRAYKDINLLGFKLLRPGGLLFTYSCSGGISDDLFQKIIAGAALDAGVDAQIVKKLTAAADHPVLLSFPEGAYLKGLVLRVAG